MLLKRNCGAPLLGLTKYKEDIAWPRGDTKFLFEYWKIFHEWNIFQHEKRNFVSPSGHVMFYLLYKHQWNAKPFHFNIFFCCEGAMYHVAIATVIFSHVKITCYFHMWRYHVFARKLTWYFIGIYIINIIILYQDDHLLHHDFAKYILIHEYSTTWKSSGIDIVARIYISRALLNWNIFISNYKFRLRRSLVWSGNTQKNPFNLYNFPCEGLSPGLNTA